LFVLVAGFLFVVLGACGKEPEVASEKTNEESSTPSDGPNVIVIVCDAMRADHLSCYGYARKTSPFMDRLGAEGALFERVTSCSTITRESVPAIFTGRHPSSSGITGGAVGGTGAPDPARPHLGRYFHDAGYATAFLTDSYALTAPPFTEGLGFDKVVLADQSDSSGKGFDLTQQLLDFVKACNGRKFMAYIHYLDPHAPYKPPDDYYLRFADTVYPNPVPLLGGEGVRNNCAQFIKDGFGPGDPRFEDLVLRYDAEIAFVDDAIRALYDGLKTLGVLENTIVVLTSDHGEEFLEHGFWAHGWTVYEESSHVPLIFWRPGRITPARVPTGVSHVDLLPTVLTLADIEYDAADLDGLALLTRAQGLFRPKVQERPIVCELLLDHRNLLRSIVKDEWKYIAAMKWRSAELRYEDLQALATIREEIMSGAREPMDIWSPVIHEELYHLAVDPGEKQDRIGQAPQTEMMRNELDTYKAYCVRHGIQRVQPPGGGKELTTGEIDSLKALGYMGK